MSLMVAKKLIRDLKKNGYQAYLVGGVVRDFLMRKEFSDIDITTNAKPFDVMKLFKTIPTGLKYGSVTVLYEDYKFEVTTFRKDGPTCDFRHPDSVIYSSEVKDDIERRDFTMNGILMDERQNIYDYIGGQQDIHDKVIRAIGDPNARFNEDALRILRALYFQSKLGFSIEPKTKQAMMDHRLLIANLANERVHAELIKILQGKYLKLALETMVETRIHEVLPGLEKGILFTSKLEQMPFIDTFFSLSFTLNNGVIPSVWTFSNIHRHKYLKASEVALKVPGMVDNVTLYHYGLETCLLANKVNYYLGKSKHLSKIITKVYDELPIKSELDLALSSQEIMTIMNKKAGSWLGNLKKEMINDVLTKHVLNTKESLTKYLEKKRG